MPWVRGKWGPPARLVFRGPGPLQLVKSRGSLDQAHRRPHKAEAAEHKSQHMGVKETFIKRYFGSDVFR
jgi:hypothetical protein